MSSIIDGVDYGPLAQLIGKWVGNKGLDVAPDANAEPDESPFSDELIFVAAGPSENAEEQDLVALRYHHTVRKLENGRIFHDQIGHWLYEPKTNTIMHSLSIPRAVCLLAGGKYQSKEGESIFEVEAKAGSETFGIVQSPFMFEKARTTGFHMKMRVNNDELEYHETTSLHIYEKNFEHVDSSILHRVIYD